MDRLRRARKAKGLSIQDLTRLTGVPHQALRNLERSGGAITRDTRPENVTLRTAVRLCEVLWPELQLEHFLKTDLRLSK